LNPYDKFLNKEFYKPKSANKWNRQGTDRDFNYLVSMMSKYALVGVAHPVRYTTRLKDKKFSYVDEMMSEYKNSSNKLKFTEGYYQVYPRYYEKEVIKTEILPYMDYINKKADNYNIIKTGSTDSHGMGIFD
jgi:hypothetical protein